LFPRFLTEVQADLEEFKAQAKFKSFATDFSAQLLLFDKAKEWADLIKCLQRITRVRTFSH
jgi:hypothetical protein